MVETFAEHIQRLNPGFVPGRQRTAEEIRATADRARADLASGVDWAYGARVLLLAAIAEDEVQSFCGGEAVEQAPLHEPRRIGVLNVVKRRRG